jgi:malonate transporter MadL subunit
MVIYGVALLAGCYLAGQLIGIALGSLMDINTNVGGVGFAMILLIFIHDWVKNKGLMRNDSQQGILFWAAMYIPVVVAMSSIQNVVAALSGGIIAIVAGVTATAVSMMLVPIVARRKISKNEKN